MRLIGDGNRERSSGSALASSSAWSGSEVGGREHGRAQLAGLEEGVNHLHRRRPRVPSRKRRDRVDHRPAGGNRRPPRSCNRRPAASRCARSRARRTCPSRASRARRAGTRSAVRSATSSASPSRPPSSLSSSSAISSRRSGGVSPGITGCLKSMRWSSACTRVPRSSAASRPAVRRGLAATRGLRPIGSSWPRVGRPHLEAGQAKDALHVEAVGAPLVLGERGVTQRRHRCACRRTGRRGGRGGRGPGVRAAAPGDSSNASGSLGYRMCRPGALSFQVGLADERQADSVGGLDLRLVDPIGDLGDEGGDDPVDRRRTVPLRPCVHPRGAAQDQPLLRTRHRDVEQPPLLGLLAAICSSRSAS